MVPMNTPNRLQVTRRVSLVSALTNLLLAVIKIIIGWIGHSHALIADGVHSFSDLLSDALVYFAAKMGDRKPDKEHPYGHHRIETMAVVIIAIFLLAIGAGIAYESVSAIVLKQHHVTMALPVVITAIISIGLNEWLFRYTLKAGKLVKSDLLISNAWHNRSDALVSIIVLLSIIGALLGFPYLDAIGAGIIALLILKMAFKMLSRSLSELIDAAVDAETSKAIRETIIQVNGVTDIHMLRTRLHAGMIFIDVHILVDPKISVSEGHYISDQVQKVLFQQIENIKDVTVHIDPEDDEARMPSLDSPSRAHIETTLRKAWSSLPSYDMIDRILIHYLDGKLEIEVFFLAGALQHESLDHIKPAYLTAAQQLPDIEKIEFHVTL